jgi:uncharacterized repeat protein (TIGR01451 family)
VRIRRWRGITAGLAAITAVGGMALTAGPARAVHLPYSGQAATEIVHVTAAAIPDVVTVADAGVAPASAVVNSAGLATAADKRSTARAANADANLLDAVPLEGLLVEATQTAPPDHAQPTVETFLELPLDPVLTADAGTASAHARWAGDDRCVAPGTPISKAENTLANLNVLDATAELESGQGGAVRSTSTVGIVDVPGQATKGLQSQAITQVTGISLGDGALQVNVLAPPVVTATATGQPGGATVTYSEPVLQIVQDGEVAFELNAADGNTTFDALPLLRLKLGTLENVVQAADGTKAAGTATLLEVELLSIVPLLDPGARITIAGGRVEANVPVGGIDCPGDDNPLRETHKDLTATQVTPGTPFDYTVVVPNRGDCPIDPVKVVDTVTAPDGTTIVASDGGRVEGKTVTWDNIGPLAANDTKSLKITITVPAGTPNGTRLRNDVNVTGTVKCPGAPAREVTTTAFVDGPVVQAPGFNGCGIAGSNKAASHLEVIPGESFNYYIHAFNSGTEPCNDVVVTDTLIPQVTFVSCSNECARDGQNLTWSLGNLAPGEARTLVVTVKVADGVTSGRLPDDAVITARGSSGPGAGPTTLHTDGPEVTQRSVLAPPNPAGGLAGELPKTGGPAPLAGLGLAALALGALGRRTRRRLLA